MTKHGNLEGETKENCRRLI